MTPTTEIRLDELEAEVERVMEAFYGPQIINGQRDIEAGIWHQWVHGQSDDDSWRSKLTKTSKDGALGLLAAIEAIRWAL